MKRQENTKREIVSQQNAQLKNFAQEFRSIKKMSWNNLKKELKASITTQAYLDKLAMAHAVYSRICR